MSETNLDRCLRKIRLFQEMSDKERRIIFKDERKENYKAGSVVFDHNEKGGTLYLIVSGSVKIIMPNVRSDNREEDVSVLAEGDSFGELSFFDESTHSARAVAIEDVELLEIDHESLNNIIKENLELGFEMQRKIVLRVVNILREMNTRYSFRSFRNESAISLL